MKTEVILYKISDHPELIDFTKLYYRVDKSINVSAITSAEKLIAKLNESKHVVLIFQSLIASDLNYVLTTLNEYRNRSSLHTCNSICLIKSKNSSVLSLLDKNKCNLALPIPKVPQELTNSIDELLPVVTTDEEYPIYLEELKSIFEIGPEVNTESGVITAKLHHLYNDKSILYFSEFMDMFNNSIFLKLTNGTDLSHGTFSLNLTFEYEGDKITIESKVNAFSAEPFDNEHEIIEFRLGKDGIHAIKEFHKLITRRQSNINIFMARARGF